MTGNRIVFDREKNVLGWKKSDCKYCGFYLYTFPMLVMGCHLLVLQMFYILQFQVIMLRILTPFQWMGKILLVNHLLLLLVQLHSRQKLQKQAAMAHKSQCSHLLAIPIYWPLLSDKEEPCFWYWFCCVQLFFDHFFCWNQLHRQPSSWNCFFSSYIIIYIYFRLNT